MDNRFLIIARVGDQSQHANWLRGAQPHFDLFLSYEGNDTNRYKQECTFYDQQPGERWPVLSQLIEQYWELISTYEAIWFACDSLDTNAANINTLFALFCGHQLALAQPALSLESHYHNPIFLQQKKLLLRFVNNVETTAPVMTNHTLSLLHPTFNNTGVNNINTQWPALIPGPKHNHIAIIDAAPVIGTEPLSTASANAHKTRTPYKIYSALKISPSYCAFHAYLRGLWHAVSQHLAAKRAKRKTA